jgi:hypothetical protein
MADPVSAGLSAASSLAGAIGSVAGGNNAAAIASQNAGIALQQGNVTADQLRRQGEMTVGRAIANAGAAGVDPNSGSPLAVRMQDAGQSALQQQTALYNARLKALGLDYEASQDQAAGQVGAVGTLLSGAGKAFQSSGGGNLTQTIASWF